jgi:hypothetical protein
MLHDSVASHWLDIMPKLEASKHIKVVCRVYASFRSMAEATMPISSIDGLALVEEFARGFTQAYPSFDFIDVRYENGVAEKIIGMFMDVSPRHKADTLRESVSHQLGDHRCKHIVLGCSTTAALAPYLNQLGATVPRSLDHIKLLQGIPWHPEILGTLFGKVRYGSLFRTELSLQSYSPISQPPGLSSRKTSCASAVDSGVHTPAVPPGTPALVGTSKISWAAKAKAAIHIPEPLSPASRPMTPLRRAGGKNATLPAACAEDENGIVRNKKGQRVDPPIKAYNRDEVTRIKKMKLCNVHYLRPACPYSEACGHEHKYTLLKGELDTLKLVARMSPCLYGSECDDPGCIYGHRCPAPERMDGAMPRDARAEGKTCVFGMLCRFPGEMHDRGVAR